MELKSAIECRGKKEGAFKLYLYGIEMLYEYRDTRYRPLVQIVPLWNWNLLGFVIPIWAVLFKLYLYGIEIGHCTSNSLLSLVQIVPLWNWNCSKNIIIQYNSLFKLYLYGIEIFITLQNRVDRVVQIVPLWNWNGELYIEDGTCYPFKLYLYGIEIRMMQVKLRQSWECSNCTFMELKWWLSDDRFCCAVVFKLYLYGIEMMAFWR